MQSPKYGLIGGMNIASIDHIVLAASNLEAAAAPFERLGLNLTPRGTHQSFGTENRAFFVGNQESEFYVELLGVHDRAAAEHAPSRSSLLRAIDTSPAVFRLMLGTDDLAAAKAKFATKGIACEEEEVFRGDGTKIGDVLRPEATDFAGCEIALMKYAEPAEARRSRHATVGLHTHGFPLKRLDHLAVFTPTLEETTRFWVETLGVPVFGEVTRPGVMIIRQMKIGDAVVELLGPDGADSPMAKRPPGIASMAAFEVPNLDEAVALARERGFTVPEGAVGILPGTRVATIPPTELSGMALQLLEYV